MLKKLAMIAMVGSLTACGHPQYSHQPRVYVEQQIYLRRYANCSTLRTTHDERSCQANERSHYSSCMTR
jgi:hypothetical protein